VRRWTPAVLAVVGHPSLWGTAAHQAVRLARRGGRSYLRFRAETQYGDAEHAFVAADVVNYLAWCRRMERLG
jgi:hypothetical protein